MKPTTATTKHLSEIGLLLTFHPPETKSVEAWDTKIEKNVDVLIEVPNVRSSTHLLSIDTVDQMRIFLMRFGLKASNKEIDGWLGEARKRFGVFGNWLNACCLRWSLHGLCGFDGQPQDRLLIQNKKASHEGEDGMFVVKKKLLNKYYESIGSDIRFVQQFTATKII